MGKWHGTLVWMGVFALAAATLAASMGELSWAIELFSHFRPHLAALSFLWLFVALFQHRPLAVVASAALLALNAAPLVPYVLPQPQEAAAGGAPLRVMTFNMHGSKTKRAAFLDYVQTEQPDVILLTELPPHTDWLVDSLGADYRYRLGGTLGTPHDLLLFSRWPIGTSRIDRSVSRGSPVIAADLCREAVGAGACVRLVGLHAIAPFARFARLHTAQLELAARLATAAPEGQAILAGDLNMTPWSPTFHRLLAESGLRDAALGRSITATWLSRQPMVGIAIDHVLASPDIAVGAYDVGPDLGSDHLPVVATMAVPQTPPATIGESR